MLQPQQLKDVSTRYPEEIAELTGFLQKANCVSGTEQSLHSIAARLQRDKSFHRDLTSHIWVVVHLANRNISYADLLGVLAIAAAGARFAAEAPEEDAHALLRFVMEARQSLDGTSSREHAVAVQPPAPLPFAVPPRLAMPEIVREQEIVHRQSRAVPLAFASTHQEEDTSSRTRPLWLAAFALLAASAGMAWHYRTMLSHAFSPAPVATVTAPPPPTVVSDTSAVAGTRSEVVPAVVPAAPATKKGTHPHVVPPAPKAKGGHKSVVPAHSSAPPPVVAAVDSSKAPLPVPSHPAATPTPATKKPSNAKPGARAVALGGTPAAPGASDMTNTYRGSQPPHLVRRTPEERGELIAEARPPDVAKAAPSTPIGTVRATTLGSTASRVLYSPTPAYPQAASAAHVQGEVRLEANVDNQGNVASVRVISGPPLLREAALDAAQRWRYRPNVTEGRLTSMSAITVFAFQLPQ